jgi:hypothetical protein
MHHLVSRKNALLHDVIQLGQFQHYTSNQQMEQQLTQGSMQIHEESSMMLDT